MAKVELDVAEMVEETFEKHFGVTLDRLRELAEADKDGRCVVLPCKVGDTVWYIDQNRNEICKLRVQGITINYNGLPVFHLGDWVSVSLKQLSSVWFLTRPEAEAAIAKEKDGQHVV